MSSAPGQTSLPAFKSRQIADANRSANIVLLAAGLFCSKPPILREAGLTLLASTDTGPVLANYDYLLRRAIETRTIPMLHSLSREQRWLRSEILDQLVHIISVSQKALLATALPPIKAMHDDKIDFAAIKGTDFIYSLYPPDLPRHMADLDIIVKPPSLDSVTELMSSLGFSQGAFNRDTLMITPLSTDEMAQFKTAHYEIPPFLKLIEIHELFRLSATIDDYFQPRDFILTTGDTVFLLAQIDTHFNLSFDIRLGDIWTNCRRVQIPGQEWPALSWETNAWFLAARLYVEAMTLHSPILRSFIDLANVVAAAPNLWSNGRPTIINYTRRSVMSSDIFSRSTRDWCPTIFLTIC